MMIYVIDGSLAGLLCAVFECFERRSGKISLQIKNRYQSDAFSEALHIHNDQEKADRVWKGLGKKLPPAWMRRFYCTFLSELPDSHQILFDFACYCFSSKTGAEKNYGNPFVLRVAQIARMTEREKHRMEAFIRFKKAADGLFYCTVEPDFNVLPLISKHFRERYADQRWIIYDRNRNYGLYYDLSDVVQVSLEINDRANWNGTGKQELDEQENKYAGLWKTYFKSTNIEARKNTKLHVRHVPKRYWKYLTEIG